MHPEVSEQLGTGLGQPPLAPGCLAPNLLRWYLFLYPAVITSPDTHVDPEPQITTASILVR
jgi:hypothetical protein